MMSKKFIAGTFAFALGAATVFAGSYPTEKALASTEKKYIVVFKDKGNLPANYEKEIKSAGGKVESALRNLGAAEVVSSNPNFLKDIEKSTSVMAAGNQHIVYPEKPADSEALTVEGSATSSSDLYEKYQWDIKQVTDEGKSWEMKGGTGKSTNGKDIVIGVIDTGIDYHHPDIKENYAYGKSFVPGYPDAMDQDGHGTHVAGSIAGKGRVMGVGPELKVAAYRVFGPSGGAETSHIADALRTAADDNVDVVNMSLGGYDWFQNPEFATKDVVADVHLFNRAIQYAIKKGVTVVGSAGNNGVDISSPGKLSGDDKGATHRSPSSQQLIRVSSGGKLENLAYYSNYGVGKIDVMAPGGDRGPNYDPVTKKGGDNSYMSLSTVPVVDAAGNVTGHGYAYYIGTSMAAPKTAALAGVIIAKHGKDQLSPAQVKHILQSSSKDVFKKGYDEKSGFGLINAVSALK
ncbi:S8 family serine peptidase [Bacillus massilinigeriensis]|uniref:S8 family serine peptidase n=1 Tax=Bacillus mediterraneensis TaxID=1805474 RepID=UPI0008F806CD|nr:S8 family serine peptidase [Bacillus mediterraneensis]